MLRTKLEHPESTAPNFRALNEQTEYLRGALFADVRMDEDLDPALIDPYGTGNQHFWRGFIEACAIVEMYPKPKASYIPVQGPTYPHVEFKASHAVLVKFIAFLQEEIHTRQGIQWKWDDDGKIESRARRESFCATSRKGQEVVRVLYLNSTVSKNSYAQAADRIVQWVPRRQY